MILAAPVDESCSVSLDLIWLVHAFVLEANERKNAT